MSGKHYEIHDELALAERQIWFDYRENVAISRKNKRLRKFGRALSLQSGTIADVTSNSNVSETYQTTNTIDSVVSSSVADIGDVITVEGHTVDGSGNFTFVVQSVTLDGQTPQTLATPLARASRSYNSGTSVVLGTISTYRSAATAVSGGVPTTPAAIHMQIPAGKQQSFKCATTFSSTDYFIIDELGGTAEKSSGSTAVDFELQIRNKGGVFREQFPFTSHSTGGTIVIPLLTPIIVPANADIRMRATATTNNTLASAWFGGHLALVIE